jgi:hypothetical protein
LQQWYWVQYSISKNFPNPSGTYQVLSKLDRQGQHSMATDADVMPAPSEVWPSFALTAKARQAGAVALKVDTVHYTSAQMNRMLAERIYLGQTPGDLLWPAWVGALGVFVLTLVLAMLRNRTRRRIEEPGRRLKGPEMVTVKEFNQWSGGDGISFLTTQSRESLSIPRSLESSHMMMMGDTGAGKSVLQRRVLMQIAERARRPSCTIRRSNTRRSFSIPPVAI